ncbi:unnamed protein product [Thelazia callipaeda]|uniref:EGF-like domain-containing protein n=1 Tax=Thelazia callipaeda TaxID=103827 RepID=A0A0N5CRR0_THECL|nr:unnamed protein product [Thelazia callipaeda]
MIIHGKRTTAQWLWWSTLIFLLLRDTQQFSMQVNSMNSSEIINMSEKIVWSSNSSAAPIKPRPKTPKQLNIPECEDSINDCTYGGKCVTGPNGLKSCLCPASCPACEFLVQLKFLRCKGFMI